MGKIVGKVPKLQEKLFDFTYFRQKFDRLFLSPYRLRKKTSKKKEQSATVPKDVYCYRYCFLETKECMHNEVGTCAEILPLRISFARNPVELDVVVIDRKKVEVVSNAKLLALTISANLTSNVNIEEVVKKGSKRLYFLAQLKRAKSQPTDLILF